MSRRVGSRSNRRFVRKPKGTVARSLARSMIVWVSSNPAQDPIATSDARSSLITLANNQQVSTIFVDIWFYLGATNGSPTKTTALQALISGYKAADPTRKVYALQGAPEWSDPSAHPWVNTNITQKVLAYNNASSADARFDGFTFNIEYWTDSQTTASAVAGLATLVADTRTTLGLPVGLRAPAFLLDSTATRPSVTYNGKTAQDGVHMIDFADHVIVAAYQRYANPT